MNGLEALIWRSESKAQIRSTMVAVELLDCVPDWERLRAAHEWGVRLVPRFRQRVAEPAFGVGLPGWEEDPEFELDRHLGRATLDGGADLRPVLELAAEVAMAPFDRRRPLWQGVLVDGLADGRAAYILKLHHSLADGIGSVQLVDMLHSDRREPTPDKPDRPPLELRRRASADLLREQLTGVVRGAPGALLRAGTSGLGGARHAVAQPTRTAVDALRFAASLDRVAKTQPAPPSPLLAPRSLRWHFEALDVSLRDLRAAGKAAGASLNDAYVAALLGAFRRYHEEFGLPIAELPVAVPVSLRRSADEPGANRFTGVRFAAPVGEPDPRLRIRRVRELIDRERTEPALPALAGAASLFGVLPGQISGAFAARLAQANDLQASNIPGLARPAYMAGARITHIYPFGPLPGCAAMITLISHEGTCCIGANLDAAAWTDTALFASCLGQGFEEVLSLSTSALRRSSSSVGASPAATR